MRVYQYWLNRFSTLIVALLLIAIFFYATVTAELTAAEALYGGAFFVLPLLIASLRCIPGGVEGTDTELIVRGWIWSRRIPRASVVDVSSTALVWNDAKGRRRTLLTMFWNGWATWGPIVAHNEAALHRIRSWVSGESSAPPRHRRD